MVFPPFESFCGAKIEVEQPSLVKRIASESVRAGRNRISAGPIEVCRRKCVYWSRTSDRNDRSQVELSRLSFVTSVGAPNLQTAARTNYWRPIDSPGIAATVTNPGAHWQD